MIYANIHADGHSSNSLFGLEDSVHRYNPTYTPRLIRKRFLEHGIELNTPDVNQGRQVAFDIHLEGRPLTPQVRPRYLVATENPNINKLNASPSYCEAFDLVFAWDVRLHHLAHTVPIMIPHPMIIEAFPGPDQRDIFSCLINANKAFKEVLDSDLYLERLRVIRWHERFAPADFDLYGLGWDKETPAYTLGGRIARSASRLKSRLFGVPPFPSFRGEVREKAEVLRRARFSYCYENNRDIPNYITEKMLDSLVSGCVPVYWGADNVLDHVPADCFIDRRKFANTADVHRHLLTIDDARYQTYQDAIRDFLLSPMARAFSSDQVIETIVTHIHHDLQQRQLM